VRSVVFLIALLLIKVLEPNIAAAEQMSLVCAKAVSADGKQISPALEMSMLIDTDDKSVLLFGSEAQSAVYITETSILWTRGDNTFLIGRGSGSIAIQSVSEPEKVARGICSKSENKF
jgi:hypothetical protein